MTAGRDEPSRTVAREADRTREEALFHPTASIFHLNMPRRRATHPVRRQASQVATVVYDSGGLGEDIPPSSPPYLTSAQDLVPGEPRKKRVQQAATEDAPFTGRECEDFLSQMPFDVILEVWCHDITIHVRWSAHFSALVDSGLPALCGPHQYVPHEPPVSGHPAWQ